MEMPLVLGNFGGMGGGIMMVRLPFLWLSLPAEIVEHQAEHHLNLNRSLVALLDRRKGWWE